MSYDTATYIDSVPVKISERFRAPRKVTLSSSCSHHLNTDILTAEYDVTMEIETSKYLEKLRNHKEERKKVRDLKINQYEEEKARIIKEIERLRAEKIEEEQNKWKENEYLVNNEEELLDENHSEISKEISGDEGDLENTESDGNKDKKGVNEQYVCNSQISSIQKGENTADIPPLDNAEGSQWFSDDKRSNIVYSRPTSQPKLQSHLQYSTAVNSSLLSYPPILVPTQCSPKVSYHKSPTNSRCSINFADFEGDSSDPFDSVALKSINDMEELAQVLQNSNVKQEKSIGSEDHLNHSSKPPGNYQQPGTLINGAHQDTSNPYQYMSCQQSKNYHINLSAFNHKSSYESNISSSPASQSTPLTVNCIPIQPGNSYLPLKYSQWNSPPVSNALNSSHLKTYNYAMPHTILPSNASVTSETCGTTVSIGSPSSSGNPAEVVRNHLSHLNMQISESVGKRQDLEEFYSRYYSNKKLLRSGARSGENTPTSFINSKVLSSSSSVPDLTAVEDSELSKISFKKNNFDGSCRPTTPTRPSSTGGYEITNAAFEPRAKSPQKLKIRLPDPFIELTEDAQFLVQNMAEMGFPRTRVARAVQKLGTDHKKLLEVLLTLQSFQESGEDEYRTERAFYYFMGEVDKVTEFLHASKTLLDLGFEEEQVIEHLFKNQNDKDKCLEELIA